MFTVKALGIARKLYELDYSVYEYRVNHKQRKLNYETFYDTLCGFRDTLRMIIKYDMKYMFEKNYWYFMKGMMSLIAQYAFCGNKDFDDIICEINNMAVESGWDNDETHILTEQIMEYKNRVILEQEKIVRILSKEKSVIIYGAGNNTLKLLSNYQEQVQNVIGIAVSKKDENLPKCKGFSVRNIEYYIPYKDEVMVLITPAEKARDEIINILEKLEFKRYDWINMQII